jgi:hypothetical protein
MEGSLGTGVREYLLSGGSRRCAGLRWSGMNFGPSALVARLLA